MALLGVRDDQRGHQCALRRSSLRRGHAPARFTRPSFSNRHHCPRDMDGLAALSGMDLERGSRGRTRTLGHNKREKTRGRGWPHWFAQGQPNRLAALAAGVAFGMLLTSVAATWLRKRVSEASSAVAPTYSDTRRSAYARLGFPAAGVPPRVPHWLPGEVSRDENGLHLHTGAVLTWKGDAESDGGEADEDLDSFALAAPREARSPETASFNHRSTGPINDGSTGPSPFVLTREELGAGVGEEPASRPRAGEDDDEGTPGRLRDLLRRREEELRSLRRRAAAAEAMTARLWGLVEDLEGSARTTASLALRETCDAKPHRRLPDRIRRLTSDLRMRRLWGSPADDPHEAQRYLLSLTVGVKQMDNVDRLVRAFDPNAFVVVLFHYDGEVDAWRSLPWSDKAVHVSGLKQSKWWFAKRFLHPDVVAPYDFVFVWDEDIDVHTDGFDWTEYLRVVRDNGLHISQPALISGKGAWPVTRRVPGAVMHRLGKDWSSRPCLDSTGARRLIPPCAAYVEIMVPVFSRYAWRCVWTMIQNDLTHGWGLDLTWHTCAADMANNRSAVDGMGVVDAQGVRHLGVPTLGEQGEGTSTVSGMMAVSRRRVAEWDMYNARWSVPNLVAYYAQGDDLESTKASSRSTEQMDHTTTYPAAFTDEGKMGMVVEDDASNQDREYVDRAHSIAVTVGVSATNPVNGSAGRAMSEEAENEALLEVDRKVAIERGWLLGAKLSPDEDTDETRRYFESDVV